MNNVMSSCQCNKPTCTCTSPNCSCANGCACCLEEKIVTITAEDLKDNLERSANFVVINVLDEDVFNDCHIKGSINIPLAKLKETVQNWDKNKSIVTYCAQITCPLSKKAYVVLRELGFKRIAAFEGGMKEWKQKGLESVGKCERDYLR
jgi:rhodanese-related sulfurtransferase